MKFICDKVDLLKAVNNCAKAVSAKPTIPALGGLLFVADADSVRITGYDLKEAISTTFPAAVLEQGSAVADCKLVCNMAKSMPDGRVTVGDSDGNIRIKCGKCDFKFAGFPVDSYPELPKVDARNSLSIPQNIVKSLIEDTSYATSSDDSRPIYTGVLFDVMGDTVTAVATDGFRLAKRVEVLDAGSLHDCRFVIPNNVLKDIKAVCTDQDKPATIGLGDRHIIFTTGDTEIISRMLEGEFMNYNKALQSIPKYNVLVDKLEFIKTLERVSLIIDQANLTPVKIKFGDGVIDCTSATPLGNAEDTCVCEGNGEDITIGFNARYIAEALKAVKENMVCVAFDAPTAPCKVLPADGSDKFVYMVLPVRMRN